MKDAADRLAALSPARRALLEQLLRERAVAGVETIPRRVSQGDPPLSLAQRRLWFLDRLGESGPAYNIVSALELRGALDPDALQRALARLCERHESLRTVFPAVDGEPVQRILPPAPLALPVEPLAFDRIEAQIREEAWRGFSLDRGPLLRLRLFRAAAERHVLVLVMHHIISDGWSVSVLIRELAELYAADREGRAPALAPLPIQYADFAEWHHARLTPERLAELAGWWQRRLEGLPRVLQLPHLGPRPSHHTHRGSWQRFHLDPALSRGVDELALAADTTPFVTLLSAFGLLLGRLAGVERLAVGCPMANRTHAELEPQIGLFVNTLAMPVELDGDPTVRELLQRQRATALEVFQRQDLPFDRLVEQLAPPRDLSRNPLVQVVFAVQQSEAMAQRLPLRGVEVEPLPLRELPARFDLELHMWREQDRWAGALIHYADLYDEDLVAAWVEHLQALLAAMVADPDAKVGRLSLWSDAQRARLEGWQGAPLPLPPTTVHRLFAERAAASPDAVAVADGERQLSYAELARASSRVAQGLLRDGLLPGEAVGVALPRSAEALIAILGVLKAGGVYLPVDLDSPAARVRAMLTEAGARRVIGARPAPSALAGLDGLLALADWDGLEAVEPDVEDDPERAAYINFTSGSSGTPKGIVIPHRGVLRLILGADYVDIRPGDTVAHAANLAFDAATFEIWGALLSGGRVLVVPRAALLDPARLGALLLEQRVDHVFLTTALFNRMVDHAPEGLSELSTLLFGGEMSDPARVARLLAGRPPRRLMHVYGPTECTTFATAGRVRPENVRPGELLSIGRPIVNTHAWVVDAEGRLCGIGASGELWLGGAGLAQGYLGRPELTDAGFVPDPFGPPGGRLYRTGDRARWRPSGEIDILGRLDRQVKIRGFRIEPGEIEARLSEHPAVREAAVVVQEGDAGERRLLAFVAAAPRAEEVDAATQVDRWRSVFDQHVYRDTAASDPTFNHVGWLNSEDGSPIPEPQMRAWAADIIGQALARRPRRVLEIGFGTGMLLFRIAPHTEAYHGIDLSGRSVAYVAERTTGPEWAHLTLREGPAHRLDELVEGTYDLVILNSVVQYFPDLAYLQDVLGRALARLAPGGAVLLGDVRNLRLMGAFHRFVLRARAPDIEPERLRLEVARRMAADTELYVDPSFFQVFARRFPQLRHVALRLQASPWHNEMSRYRYTAVLDTRAEPPVVSAPIEEGAPSPTALRERLASASAPFGLRFYNARLAPELPPGAQGRDPEELRRLGAEAGWRSETSWADEDETQAEIVYFKDDLRVLFPPLRPREPFANAPLRGGQGVDRAAELRAHLLGGLPSFMMPHEIVVMEQLPLGPTGKIDRAALLSHRGSSAPPDQGPVLGLDDALEEVVRGLCAEVLGVSDIAATDNFFERGGHSLIATTLATRLGRAYGREVPLRLIFEQPTPRGLAGWLRERMGPDAVGEPAPPILPMAPDQPRPASFAQRRLWFLCQLDPEATPYHMPLVLELDGALDVDALARSLEEILDRHESLRTGFEVVEGEPVQVVHPLSRPPLERRDLRGLSAEEQALAVEAEVRAVRSHPFDLRTGPMATSRLLWLSERRWVLAGAFHHIASDGWSVEVFVRELSELYGALVAGRPSPLPPLPIQYGDFAAWQRRWLAGETLERQLDYWRRQLEGIEPLDLPTDRPRDERRRPVGAQHDFTIEAGTAGALRRLSVRHGATLFMTLLAGFCGLMHRYTGNRRVAVGVPIANRHRPELRDLIGFFVNTLVLCADLEGDPGFDVLVRRVRDAALGAYSHQDLPFEKLVEALAPERDLTRNPLVQLVFALQQRRAMVPELRLPGVEVHPRPLEGLDVRFDLEFHLYEDQELVRGVVLYDATLFDPGTVERLTRHYLRLLDGLVEAPEAPLSSVEYLSPEEIAQFEAWE